MNFLSGGQNIPWISEVGSSPNIKKLILWLSVWDDELLSTPNLLPQTSNFLMPTFLRVQQCKVFKIMRAVFTKTM